MESVRFRNGALEILDQRLLPFEERYLSLHDARGARDAIAAMAVRGAPAIGLSAAYAVALAAREAAAAVAPRAALQELCAEIAGARPTAVNLRFEVQEATATLPEDPNGWYDAALRYAEGRRAAQQAEDEAIARHAMPLFRPGMRVLTHCNTGGLATGGSGTALGAIIAAHRALGLQEVLADETRPRLQGARLTAYELQQARVPHHVIVDGAAAHFMARGSVDLVIVGADRIGQDGRTANKIGTYMLAVLAQHHGIPFVVAAPRSSCDSAWQGAGEVEIEQRAPEEVLAPLGTQFAAKGSPAYNPAFDVTPGNLVAAIVREDGLFRPPYQFR
ncbi:MAG: S-methyl-5-thioribose-1-phosphate isomerase [Thermaerobacter sp.]|nr:S-methyl-5-thioribose-1-phosphate isomerase [Thermaerobacter sp.]